MRFLKIVALSVTAIVILISCSSERKTAANETKSTQKSPAELQEARMDSLRADWLKDFDEHPIAQKPPYASIVIAADSGSMDGIMWYLQNGTDVGTTGQYGYTALHRAAAWKRNDMVKYLIAKGADPNQINDDGFIPLHNAAMSGDSMTVELLMKAGSIIYARDNNGMTPLHLAAMKDNFSAARALIRNGADVQDSTATRWTPRRIARRFEHMEMDSFLTAMGAKM